MKYLRLSSVVVLFLLIIYFFEQRTADQQPTAIIQNASSGVPASSGISDYQQARAVFWRELYPDGGTTLYCAEAFGSEQHEGINVEHIFPMSWVTNALSCGTRNQCRVTSVKFNLIEADLHNLYPARSDVNQWRSSFSFAEISGESRQFGKDCDFEVNQQQRVVEPAPAVRGEVARAMFYMAYRYRQDGLTIFNRQLQTLHQWHQSDPPNADERERNKVIERLQGNRNPFVDDPVQLDKLIAEEYFSA